jgi:hypothetical protein
MRRFTDEDVDERDAHAMSRSRDLGAVRGERASVAIHHPALA